MTKVLAIIFATFLTFSSLGTQAARAQVRINISHPGPVSAASILLPIAQEQGLFAKYSVEVRLILRLPPLVGKESELGFVGAPAALQQVAQGTDLKILGAFSTGRISSHLMTRPEVKNPEDLRGKRFGVGAIGAGAWIHTILALEHLGLNSKRDNISILSVGDQTKIAKALEDGTIDAAMLTPAQSGQMKSKGFWVLLDMYSVNSYGPQIVLVTTGAYLQQHPDVVEKVAIALVEAMAFSLAPTNKPTVLRTIMKEFDLTDLAAAERGYEDLRDLNRKPYPSVERLRNMQRIMSLHDPKVLSLKVEDLIEDRFVRKLDESGTIDRLYSSYGVK